MSSTVKIYSLALAVMGLTQSATAGYVCQPTEIGTVKTPLDRALMLTDYSSGWLRSCMSSSLVLSGKGIHMVSFQTYAIEAYRESDRTTCSRALAKGARPSHTGAVLR